jgi:hypothetical protein
MVFAMASAAGRQSAVSSGGEHCRTDQRKAEESHQQHCGDSAHRTDSTPMQEILQQYERGLERPAIAGDAVLLLLRSDSERCLGRAPIQPLDTTLITFKELMKEFPHLAP